MPVGRDRGHSHRRGTGRPSSKRRRCFRASHPLPVHLPGQHHPQGRTPDSLLAGDRPRFPVLRPPAVNPRRKAASGGAEPVGRPGPGGPPRRSAGAGILPLGRAGPAVDPVRQVSSERGGAHGRLPGRQGPGARLPRHHRIQDPGGLGPSLSHGAGTHSSPGRRLLGGIPHHSQGLHPPEGRPGVVAVPPWPVVLDPSLSSRRCPGRRSGGAPEASLPPGIGAQANRRSRPIRLLAAGGRSSSRAVLAGSHRLRAVFRLLQLLPGGLGPAAHQPVLQAGVGTARPGDWIASSPGVRPCRDPPPVSQGGGPAGGAGHAAGPGGGSGLHLAHHAGTAHLVGGCRGYHPVDTSRFGRFPAGRQPGRDPDRPDLHRLEPEEDGVHQPARSADGLLALPGSRAGHRLPGFRQEERAERRRGTVENPGPAQPRPEPKRPHAGGRGPGVPAGQPGRRTQPGAGVLCLGHPLPAGPARLAVGMAETDEASHPAAPEWLGGVPAGIPQRHRPPGPQPAVHRPDRFGHLHHRHRRSLSPHRPLQPSGPPVGNRRIFPGGGIPAAHPGRPQLPFGPGVAEPVFGRHARAGRARLQRLPAAAGRRRQLSQSLSTGEPQNPGRSRFLSLPSPVPVSGHAIGFR